MEQILQFDRLLFDGINQGLSNSVFDVILPILRGKSTWIPLYLIIIGYLIYRDKLRSWLSIFSLIVVIGIADTMSSRIIKNAVKRPRPCHIVEQYPQTNVLVACGSGYSFTSSHATNHFAMALIFPIVLGMRSRRSRFLWCVWAALIAFSQVYVGVHYPVDILCGTLLGVSIGYLGIRVYDHFVEPRLEVISKA